jgi:hypothetical protein
MTEVLKTREIPTKEGVALLVKDILNNLNNPAYTGKMESLGFDINLLNDLLKSTYKNFLGAPVEMDYPPPPGKPVEHIRIQSARTSNGKEIETTEVTAFAPHTTKIRLQKDESIGFEAIFLREGSITYDIYPEVKPFYAGVYTEEGKPTSIILEPGDLLLIPRPVSRKISEVTKNSKYLYIGDQWVENDMPIEIY